MRCRSLFLASFLMSIYPGITHANQSRTVIDTEVLEEFPDALVRIIAAYIPDDDSGLIGRNRKWGKLYAARFQMGAGHALRIALIVEDKKAASQTILAIRKGLSTIDQHGVMQASVPEFIAQGGSPKPIDLLSGAAFFLSDACPALSHLERHPQSSHLVSEKDMEEAKLRIALSLKWLENNHSLLKSADKKAPNRLLFNAVAFYSCGKLVGNAQAVMLAEDFVEDALLEYNPDGRYFIEGGGYDTSYQAVSIHVGLDLLMHGYDAQNRAQLATAVQEAAGWLVDKIDGNGKIESANNARTCGGGETFLGEKKQLSVTSAFLAMAYGGAYFRDETLTNAAERIELWANANKTRGSSC